MTRNRQKSNLWKLTLALLIALLCVSLCIGMFAFAEGSGDTPVEKPKLTYREVKATLTQTSDIPDNHTAESILNIITVTAEVHEDGKQDSEGNDIWSPVTLKAKDHYTVALSNGKLSSESGAKNSVKVTLNGDLVLDKGVQKEYTLDLETGAVIKTTYKAELAVPNYEKDDVYYTDAEGYDAFVQGMTSAKALSVLGIALVSNNPYIDPVVYTEKDGLTWAEDYTAPETFGEAPGTVNMPATISLKYGEYTVTETINFNTLHDVALMIRDGWTPSISLSSNTTIKDIIANLSIGDVYVVQNDGSENKNITIANPREYLSDIGVVGVTAEAFISGKVGEKYSKAIEIKGSETNATVKNLKAVVLNLSDIAYANPDKIETDIASDNEQGRMSNQQARSTTLDYKGLYIDLVYGTGRYKESTKVYVADLVSQGMQIANLTFETSAGETSSVLTTKVDYISFDLVSETGETYYYAGRVKVDQIEISRPVMTYDKQEIVFSENCVTQISGLVTDDPQGDNMELAITQGADGVTSQGDGSYKFTRGGEFKFVVSLGGDSDFYWGNNGGGEILSKLAVQYTIKVLGADLDLSINLGDEIPYGETAPTLSSIVQGEVKNSPSMNMVLGSNVDAFEHGDDDPNMDCTNNPNYKYSYTGKYYDMVDGKEQLVDGYNSKEFPTKRGTYTLTVETEATSWYKSSSATAEFEIVQRQISLNEGGITIESKVFTVNTKYNLPDKDGKLPSGVTSVVGSISINNLAPGDTTATVMALSWDRADGKTDDCYHQGSYAIKLVIKDNNYKWNDDADSKTADFVITKRQLSFNVAQDGMTYGEALPGAKITNKNAGEGADFDDYASLVVTYADSKGTAVSAPASGSFWQAGTYKATYKASPSTANDVTADDIEWTEQKVDFTVTQKQLTKVGFTAPSDLTYTGSDLVFSVDKWNSVMAELVTDNADTTTNKVVIDVAGVLFDGKKITTNIGNTNNGTIKAREAGTYTFTVSIKSDNYVWVGGSSDDVTQDYVIEQKELVLKLELPENGYKFDGTAKVPAMRSPTLAEFTSTVEGVTTYNYNFTTTNYYKVVDGATEEIDPKDIIPAGKYRVEVVGFTINTKIGASDYTYAVNYKMPATNYLEYEITTTEVATPVFDTDLTGVVDTSNVKLTYTGKEFEIRDFIANWESYTYLDGTKETVETTITRDSSEAVLRNAGAYTVTIALADNYVWADKTLGVNDTVTLNFDIDKLAIKVDWTNAQLSLIYNGNDRAVEGYELNKMPNASVSNGLDDIDVTLQYADSEGAVVTPRNAGTYGVKVLAITGADKDNYSYDIDNAPITAELEIGKYSLAVPSIDGETTVAFGVTSKQFNLQDTSDVTGFNWNDALSVSVAGQWKFDNNTYGVHPENSATFSFDNGTLSFTHAGEYVITFAITNDNYQWADNLTGEQTRTLNVTRKQVTAPALGALRTIEYLDGVGSQYPKASELTVEGVTLNYYYGSKQDYATYQTDAKSATYGLYFVKVSIDGYHLDYEWLQNTADTTNINILIAMNGKDGIAWTDEHQSWGHTVYNEDESSVYLHYMITKGILKIEYSVVDYIFGDNGHNGTHAHSQADKTDPVMWGGNDKDTMIANKGTESLAFYKFDTKELASARPSNLADLTAVSDLVNGLPWDAGYYGVLVTINFPEDSLYETISEWYSFEIAKRVIVIEWSGSDTVIYDGEEHNLSAVVKNEIYKTAANDLVIVPTLNVALDDGTLPVNANANAYTLKASVASDSDNTNNFVLPADVSHELRIDKRVVKLNVVNDNYSSVYGNALTHANATWAYVADCPQDNKFVETETEGYIAYKLYAIATENGLGQEITATKPNADSYWLVPTLTASAQGNYTLECDYSVAKYVVVKREITVTLDTTNATSVYGAEVDVNREGTVFDVVWDNKLASQSDSDWRVDTNDFKKVFTLSTEASNVKAVGSYPITLTHVDKTNYQITVNNSVVDGTAELGDWVITLAGITKVQVAPVTDAPVYSGQGYNIVGDLITVSYELIRPNDNVGSVKVYYVLADGLTDAPSADADGWTEITSAKQLDAINKAYYFKITADNHSDYIVETPCDVVVNKATLEVSINLSIWYGENSPAKYDGTNAFKATVTELLKANADGAMYNVYGFKTREGVLETITSIGINADGTFSYTTNYSKGDPAGNYGLTFVNNSLVTTNYEFVNKVVANGDEVETAGKLEVKRLALTVQIEDIQNVYYQTYQDVKFVTKVTLPNSTYEPDKSLKDVEGDVYSDIYAEANAYEGANVITLTTTAFADTELTTHSKFVGDYDVSGSVNDANNYTAEFSGSKTDKANHKIIKATFTANEINGYIADYDEQTHNLLSVTDDKPYAEPSDGSNVNVLYYVVDRGNNELVINADKWAEFDESEISGTVPSAIDVCGKAVYYRIEDENSNYEVVYGVVEAKISQSNNEITNADSIKITDWVYGYKSETHESGYSQANLCVEPTALFYRDTNKTDNLNTFIVTIARADGKQTGLTGSYSSVKGLFDAMWAQGLFNVGKYELKVEMAGTANYVGTSTTCEFEVTQKELTITAINQTVVYGFDFTAGYTYDVEGYVVNKTGAEAENADIAFAGMDTDFFTTAYVKGREKGSVGDYAIATTANAITDKGNYSFTYVVEAKKLTVTARPVTIAIGDYTNRYNDAETNVLSYSTVDSEFYADDADKVVTLRTMAINGYGLTTLTANTNNVIVETRNSYGQPVIVGSYPVYLVWGDYAKGEGKDDYNYVITVNGSYVGKGENNALANYQSNCDEGKTIEVIIEGDSPIGNVAGSYKIERTALGIAYNGVFHRDDEENEVGGYVYSGAVNYFKATPKDENVKMTFSYGYNKTGKGNYTNIEPDQVVNVGYYIAYGRFTSDNYYDNDSDQEFEITHATVTLTANPATVQYGTLLSGNPQDVNERFSGFTYEYDKGTLLQSVYDAYIGENGQYKVTYNANNYRVNTPAGADNYTIVPVCDNRSDTTGNIVIVKESAKLTILKRNVVVTVYGIDDEANSASAQCDYLGDAEETQAKLDAIYNARWSEFISVDDKGSSGDVLSALQVSFSLNRNYEAGTYKMSVSAGDSNYNVKFRTVSNETPRDEITSDDEDAPRFTVNKAKLTIYAHMNVAGSTPNAYTVIYGNNLVTNNGVNTDINFSVVGMKHDESFNVLTNNAKPSYTVKLQGGSKLYEAWKSNVGETYVVSVNPFELTLDNYELEKGEGKSTYVDTTLTITKRTINVSTPSEIVFDWDRGANGGVYGKSHEAVLTYSDTLTLNNSEVNGNIDVNYRPVYTVLYNTSANSAYNQLAGKAPTRVGNYTVTVTLANGNYAFAGGSQTTLNFKVVQCVINENDLGWDNPSIPYNPESEGEINYIENYLNEIMEITLFTFVPYGQSGSSPIEYNPDGALGTYRYDGMKLVVNVKERGTYEVRFQLKSSATHNFKFESSNYPWIVSKFVITSASIDITLSIGDWTYSETPQEPIVTLNGATGEGVTYLYARVSNESNVGDYYGKGQLDSLEGLTVESWRGITSMTFNAGYYAILARYTGVITNVENKEEPLTVTAYQVFKVNKAKVSLPTAESDGYVFNGQEQSLNIAYLSNLVRASYDGGTSINDDGITIYATDAETYHVSFALVDDKNYEWDEGGIEKYELSWTITKDESDNVANPILTIDKTVFQSSYGSVAVTGESVANGYEGNVTRHYVLAEGRDFENIDEWAGDVEWSNGLPQNVGDYYVKLMLNGNKNFSSKETYVKLTVVPYEIQVSASGTIVYGNADWQARVRYEEVKSSPYGHRVIGTATYKLVENYDALNAGGEYYVIAEHDENGIANGLTMSNNQGANYVIKAVKGRLTVEKRDVTVTLGNASSQFGRAIDVSGVTVSYGDGQLVAGDSLNLDLYVENTQEGVNSVVGGYIINANYANDNYNVTINPGTYTITARRISIEVVQGGGTYGGEINPVTLSKVLDDANADIKDFVLSNELELNIYYVGLANDGTAYDSAVKPAKAGTYTATVRGSENDNFVITGEVSTTFVISKKALDGSKITIANQSYNGEALNPVLDDGEFVKLYGQDLYEALAHEDFVNAGTHYVTLGIKDFSNYKWLSVEVATRDVAFVIDKANNALTGNIVIAGWTYGEYDETANAPTATVRFGQQEATYLYSSTQNGVYHSGAPATGDVGEYWVKITVPETDNYKVFTSEPVKFAIVKKVLAKPVLTITAEGDAKNDVYTGGELLSAIDGFDMSLMNLDYDGKFNVNKGQVVVVAVNAGSYDVKLSLAITKNYCWQGTDSDEITLTWVVAPKPIAKPTESTDRFIVSGQLLTYIPEGFDEELMTISGNQTAYGGEFPVTIGLKDKANYVWAEGGTDDYTLTWSIVGINTVFIIVASVLGGASFVALTALAIQLIADHRKKRLIDLAIDARSQAEAFNSVNPKKSSEVNEGGNE